MTGATSHFSDKQDMSFNFEDMPVRKVLKILANFAQKDIIINDSVKGNITLSMHHTHWENALKIIVQAKGLDFRIIQNVIFIEPADEMLMWDKMIESKIPLSIEPLVIHHGNVMDIAKTLKSSNSLSSRGHMSVDKRTNALVIQDTPKKIQEIRNLVQLLDVPIRQVIIEARIVSLNRDFEKDLGIKFGVSDESHFSGTDANELAGGTVPSAAPMTERLNIDFSATSSLGTTPASVGLALAKLGNDLLLDLELSALESEGEAKIISSPRLVTVNQEPAFIESGEEIPYQESTSSGATAVIFKKAVLSLKVTPHISENNTIMMALVINQDMPNGILINGVPEVTTKEIQTNVLVNNGETLVLGGIYRQEKSNIVERVPFLSNLPGIGSIFQKKTDKIAYEELLIFITPKIII